MAIHNPVIPPTPDSVREPASTTMPVSGFISPSLAGCGKTLLSFRNDGMDLSPCLGEANGLMRPRHVVTCGEEKGPWKRLV